MQADDENDSWPSGIPTPPLIGSTVGRFKITARLGGGGMGEVYRAEDTELRRTVALKRLTPQMADDGISKNKLLREGRRASALNHPRIASVYDVFTDGNESFLVMEYVDGSTLRERLETPLSLDEFCRIAIQCTEALEAAHEKGILHGDVKPANIMLTRDRGDVKVCDFGVARRLPQAVSAADLTSTVLAPGAGTPGYMAPEVVLDKPVDARADLFSLGVVFYEMLAGRNPFRASNQIATMDRVRALAPEPLDRVNPQVPASLARLVQRMIEKDPADRYGTAVEIGKDLAALAAQLPVIRKRPGPTRRTLVRAVVASALVLVAVVSLALFWRNNTASSVPLPAEINLAVLPFKATGTGGDKQFFIRGLTEILNQQLSKLTVHRNFQVATGSDVRARSVQNPTDAREQLGANVVLTGSLEYAGNDVRITCQLIDTRSGRELRAETMTADARNSIAVEDRIVDAAVRMVGLRLTPDERAAFAGHETQQPGAYDFYLQARGYLLNYDRIESLDSAITVFRSALEIDRRYALAYAGLGEAYWRKQELTGSAVWVEPARAACEGALGISQDLSEPHTCVGMVLNGTGEYEKAVEEFRIALNLEPTNDLSYVGLATAYEKLGRAADAERTYRHAIELRPNYWAAYNTLGGYYYRLGRFDDALTMFQQVVALAPDSFRGYSSVGAVHFMKDQTAEAVAAFQKSLSIRRNYVAASNLGTLYFFEGEYGRSVEAFRQALTLDQGNYVVWKNLAGALAGAGDAKEAAAAFRRARELVQERLTVNRRDPALHLALADYNAALGDMAQSQASLAEVLKLAPTEAHTLFDLAVYYELRLKQRDKALQWLQAAIEHGQTWREIDRSPDLKSLRADHRFEQMRHPRPGTG
jgi:eukaryotic-like serine/threonine-protein kinase